MGCLAGCFARVEPRRQARKYVTGLISDLGARPLKGPGYTTGRVAWVSPTGALETVTG